MTIKSRPLAEAADDNWDTIFGKKKKGNECQETQHLTYMEKLAEKLKSDFPLDTDK